MWFSRPLSSLASLAALLGSFSVGGCAYQLNSLAAKSATDVGSKHDAKPPEVDLAYARAVAAAALARDDKDNSTTWHNPNTGAGGYITPLARRIPRAPSPAAISSRATCTATEAWLQGEACRTDHGKWEVKSLGVKRSRDPS